MARQAVPGVLGAFVHIDAAVEAIRSLKSQGRKNLTVYSAAPNHELDEAVDHPVSPVRVYTLIGGIAGIIAAVAMTFWMSYDWPLLVGGKPIATVPPYVVIMFELMVLFGSIATVAGIIIHAALDTRSGVMFDPSFSDDRVGVFVPCPPAESGAVEQLLREAGSVEVKHATA
ncbi:MAG: DUF3341 domain-containing protein [Gemmatimonadales bacterium]